MNFRLGKSGWILALDQPRVLWAQWCALICERKIGELLIAMKERKELRGRGKPKKEHDSEKAIVHGEDNNISDIRGLGLSRNESSDAQALASVPEPVLEKIIEEQTDQKKQNFSTQAVYPGSQKDS